MQKQALITGATSGIGRAAALRLAKEGYAVTATGRRADRLAALRTEIEAAGGRCTTLASPPGWNTSTGATRATGTP